MTQRPKLLSLLAGLVLLAAIPPASGRVVMAEVFFEDDRPAAPSVPSGPLPADARWSRDARRGASTALEADGARMWVADTDHDALVVLDTSRTAVVGRVPVGDGPEQVAIAPDGRVFATLRWDGAVVAVDPARQSVVGRAAVGVEPCGLALSPTGDRLYVTSAQDATLSALDARTLRPVWTARLGDADPRGVSVAPDGRRAYVVHLRAPRVSVVDLASGQVVDRLALPGQPAAGRRASQVPSPRSPFAATSIGVPNRVLASVVSTDGGRLFVGFDVKDTGGNIAAAERTGGYGAGAPTPIVAGVASLWLDGSGQSQLTIVRDLLDPSDLRVDDTGRYLFVAGAGPGVGVFSIEASHLAPRASIGAEYAKSVQLAAGRLLAHDPVSFEVRAMGPTPTPPVQTGTLASASLGGDPLPAAQAAGRALFFRRHREVSAGSFACQSCHPDGRTDGLTWNIDLGPRQTPILAGHVAETAPYHWLGSAPTLAASIRETVARLGGSGLDTGRIESLARFVAQGLPPVPNPRRAAPETDAVRRGRELFRSAELGCAHCHMPDRAFQSGGQELLGTASRPGASQALRRFDVPSLRDLGASAPYLHDGSAPDLESVLVGFNHDDRMGATAQLSRRDVAALVEYLRTL